MIQLKKNSLKRLYGLIKCVVNTTQIKSVDKRSIKEKIGVHSKKRMEEVHKGLKIVVAML